MVINFSIESMFDDHDTKRNETFVIKVHQHIAKMSQPKQGILSIAKTTPKLTTSRLPSHRTRRTRRHGSQSPALLLLLLLLRRLIIVVEVSTASWPSLLRRPASGSSLLGLASSAIGLLERGVTAS